MMNPIDKQVRAFIDEAFPSDVAAIELPGEQSLLQSGIIDSIGVLSLVTFLEETFDIRIEDDEVIPENLDSIDALVAFIDRKQGG